MPYIYRIDNTITNQFYYGARYAEKTLPDQDIWVRYFTSSRAVKTLISKFGTKSFTPSVLSVYLDADLCYSNEQDLIKEHIQNPLCLNKQYTTCEGTVFVFKGHTEESRRKLSETNKGRVPWNKGILGHPRKERAKETKPRSNKGKPSPKKGLPSPLKGRKKI